MKFEVSIKDFDKLLAINKTLVTSAARSAIDKTARAIRKEIPKGIRQRYAVTSKIKTRQQMTPGLTKTTPTKLKAGVFIRDKRNLLFQFHAKKTKRGVTVKVVKETGRKVVKGGFIAKTRSGHVGVFKRHGAKRLVPYSGSYRQGKSRQTQPIHELATISTPKMTKANMKKLAGIANGVSNKFAKELQARLVKINAKRRS